MIQSNRTPVRELIEALNTAMKQGNKAQDVEKLFYDILEFEKWTIAEAYEKGITNITNNVSMDGLQYYETTFDNQ